MKYSLGAFKNPTRELPHFEASAVMLPPSIITDISMLPVLDQQQTPACVGHAGANGVNYDYYKKNGSVPNSSPRWNYSSAKDVDGNIDEGTCALSMFKGWAMYGGSATETTVPNEVTLPVTEYTQLIKTPTMVLDAEKYPIVNEVEIQNPTAQQLMTLISQYGVVLIAVDVDEETWMNQDGNCALKPGAAGGHEILLYGYETVGNDIKFHIRNSWGTSWGNQGNGYFMWSDYQGNVYDAMSVTLSTPKPMQPIIQSSTTSLICGFEGFSSTPYQDQGGVWTIGYGTIEIDGVPVTADTPAITEEQAQALMAKQLVSYADAVTNSITVPLNQNQFDACCSLCYNIGTGGFAESTVVKDCNANNFNGAADAFLLWDKVNGQVNQDLVNRRNVERALFLTPVS